MREETKNTLEKICLFLNTNINTLINHRDSLSYITERKDITQTLMPNTCIQYKAYYEIINKQFAFEITNYVVMSQVDICQYLDNACLQFIFDCMNDYINAVSVEQDSLNRRIEIHQRSRNNNSMMIDLSVPHRATVTYNSVEEYFSNRRWQYVSDEIFNNAFDSWAVNLEYPTIDYGPKEEKKYLDIE